jgi:hypothetical protein
VRGADAGSANVEDYTQRMRSSSMDQTALQAAVSRRRCLSSPRFLGVLVFLSLAPTARTTRPDKRTKSRNRPRAEGAGVRRVQSPSSVQRRVSLDSSIHLSIHPSILSADARVLDGFLSSQPFIVRPVMSSRRYAQRYLSSCSR